MLRPVAASLPAESGVILACIYVLERRFSPMPKIDLPATEYRILHHVHFVVMIPRQIFVHKHVSQPIERASIAILNRHRIDGLAFVHSSLLLTLPFLVLCDNIGGRCALACLYSFIYRQRAGSRLLADTLVFVPEYRRGSSRNAVDCLRHSFASSSSALTPTRA